MKVIRYTDGYRYQAEEDYTHETGIKPAAPGGSHGIFIPAV